MAACPRDRTRQGPVGSCFEIIITLLGEREAAAALPQDSSALVPVKESRAASGAGSDGGRSKPLSSSAAGTKPKGIKAQALVCGLCQKKPSVRCARKNTVCSCVVVSACVVNVSISQSACLLAVAELMPGRRPSGLQTRTVCLSATAATSARLS